MARCNGFKNSSLELGLNGPETVKAQPTEVITADSVPFILFRNLAGTWHEATTRGSSFTFKFTGTSVRVVGIVSKVNIDTLMSITIDGGSPTLFAAQYTYTTTNYTVPDDYIYGYEVFSKTNLSPTSHTLSVSNGYGESFNFGLDYIEYTPVDSSATTQPATTGAQTSALSASGSTGTQTTGATVSTDASGGTITAPAPTLLSPGTTDLPTILPSDPRIVYASQQWATNTSCGLSSMMTSTVGASFVFNFTGPSIWVYTATSPQGGRYEITIDGTRMGIIDTAGSMCKSEASYHIDGLAGNSTHTLLLTNMGVASGSSGEIDFLGLSLASSGPQVGNSPSQGGGPNTAAIAGGVAGGVFILALLLFGIWMFRRRRNNMDTPTSPFVDREHHTAFADGMHGTPLTEKQRFIAADRDALNLQNPERLAMRSPPPPSFRTRAGSVRNPPPQQHISDGQSLHSSAQDESGEGTLVPPVVEDVLARPDARNLSEMDVDMIARRLAEVMRAQNSARGGPGLLREREGPSRELLDQLVGEHLSAREETD